ncbi:unnamed protein product, partial [Rotaria sp. Silwood1]
MIQTFYCRLEINFVDASDRIAMGRYAHTGALSEADSKADDHFVENLSSSFNPDELNKWASDDTETEGENSDKKNEEGCDQ